MQNTVAKILKIYAVLNALAGVFLGFYMSKEFIPEYCFVFAGACIVASFGIYAFGEVVQLLQDIKDGTNNTAHTIETHASTTNTDDDQLPKI
ncbi:hypothetical protein [Agathobaculum hominis]